ncbi:hypothetical protein GWI33_007270 [Rhynchophorus ferrugineus]|uniref:Uncharacterized protein n=1 Tax=Rhynchophorus ferrugineus TaxID=354439 RepID=A0A834MIG2_RHYFE|nr:hypothetical protein GWI33_007270 [Rhynchophorus ferrugineus]
MFSVLCHNNGSSNRPCRTIGAARKGDYNDYSSGPPPGLTTLLQRDAAAKSSYLLNIGVNLGPIKSSWCLYVCARAICRGLCSGNVSIMRVGSFGVRLSVSQITD